MGSIPFFIIAILMLGLLILVHELGHFITGRLLGFKINEFSIGMGPKLFSKEKKGILYSLRAIPMGGFVAFHGEDEEDNDPRAMNNMPWYKRAIVMFAGAGFNILFAFILTAIIVCSVGYYAPKLDTIDEKSALYAVAQQGDIIYAVNGKKLVSPAEFSTELQKIGDNETIEFSVLRDGEKIKYQTTRYFDEAENKYMIGIRYGYGVVNVNIFQSFDYSFRYNLWMTKTMYKTLGQLITGKIGLDGVTGPISTIGAIGGMVEESATGDAAQNLSIADRFRQTLVMVTELLVIISMNLAIMNLLPIPALDGFRLLFALIEGITKKHIPRKIEGIINTVGLIVLVGIMVILEISKLFVG